jgi:DNA transformation protein
MTPITRLLNLGEKTAKWLARLDIHTAEDLDAFGVVEAYCEIKQMYPDRANLNLLYSLQGALLGVPWSLLPEAMKEDLKRRVLEHEQRNPTESGG